jgi:hypothetical protein
VRRSSRDARFQRASPKNKKKDKKEEEAIKVVTTLNPRRKPRGCPSY